MGSPKPLYLAANGVATFDKPTAGAAVTHYVSDPAKPVPFLPRPVHMGDADQWKPWLVARSALRLRSSRRARLRRRRRSTKASTSWARPRSSLFAATSGTDSDWVVKLIDVYPNDTPEGSSQGAKPTMAGFELGDGHRDLPRPLREELRQAPPLKPGKVEHFSSALPHVDHVFLKGHRIMVQVQSTLFPLYDRNPQTYVENIIFAKPGDYKKATQSVWFGGATPSAVTLPVVQ